jgi:hypothetical protein
MIPSPQFTVIEATVPSESVEVKFAVTVCPVLVGFGETDDITTTGGRSFTVSVVVPDPDPPALVALTVMVYV